MELEVKDINSIKSIVWSFYHTTGLDWNDLFQEATIAYIESISSICPITHRRTYAYQVAKNRLKDFITWEFSRKMISIEHENIDTTINYQPFFELYSEFSKKAKEIADMIINSPEEFLAGSPKQSRGVIYQKLKEKGWSWSSIWQGFKEIKFILNEKAA